MPNPDLINYRLDQSDKNLTEFRKESSSQFDQLGQKLDFMTTTFATKTDIKELQIQADKEHVALWGAIEDIKKSAKWWVGTIIAVVGVIGTILGALWWVPEVIKMIRG
jgi:hypothetical protein